MAGDFHDEPRRAADGPGGEPGVLVTIGASAGGIAALQRLFAELPDDTGAGFVVVIHLDPEYRSELASILAAKTAMPVRQVTNSMPFLPNHVYVVPPDRRLQVVDRRISAEPFEDERARRNPIDHFFRSVALELGDGCAVVLSGAGSDGALGARAIKEAGGIILVQDPNEAEYPSMPRSAIATGVADFVLPVRDLAARLVELIRGKRGRPAEPDGAVDEENLRRILAHLRVRTGHDFSKYKRSTVLRRVARRMQVTRTETLREYYDALHQDSEEARALLGDLLISVTTFFRDTEAFQGLKTQVLPELFQGKEPNDTIRVWIPGCATGEEAYTIAMLLLEEASRHDMRPVVQVFGSDLDTRALAVAREGRYPAAIEADIGEDRLRRFFTREGDGFRVRQELRDVVLFAAHDLLKDPPFSRIDLISCRNVLIYFDRDLQDQVVSTFHYALNPGGFLLVGASEAAENPAGLFRCLDRGARIYQSRALPGDKPRLLPQLVGPIGLREHTPGLGRSVSPTAALSDAVAHRRAIELLAPPSFLVDQTHRVIHLSETAGRFVMPSGGPLTGDIVDLVRSELRFELRSALHRAFEQGQATLSLPIPVRFNGAPHRVQLLVRPVPADDGSGSGSAVVMLIEGEPLDETLGKSEEHQAADETVRRLSQELEMTQSRLRTVREESDAANEELRAANEELQSINEEYRSTSEELETSKEELQSINEELQTVNSELKLKLEAISRAHSDLQNLMAATDYGTLFLDSVLRIKRFTESVTQLFSITPNDSGRPITDFAHQLEYDGLVRDARGVLSDLVPVRREIHSRDGRWYEMRMRPYRTVDDKIDGVVITFIDVTQRRSTEEALRDSEEKLKRQTRLIELSRDPIFVWHFDNGIVDWNRGCEELYGFMRDEALGRSPAVLLGTTLETGTLTEIKARLNAEGSWSGDLLQRTKDGRELVVDTRMRVESFAGDRLVIETGRDITERRLWDERQRLLLRELTHRVKNTLAVAQAIAHSTFRGDAEMRERVARFDERLAALASSHGLLVQTDWTAADLGALVAGQLAPYVSAHPDGLITEGGPLALSADIATPLGLVIHELATNAAKHGALSRPSGTVRVAWRLGERDGARMLTLVWSEIGGPPVTPPSRSGLGSRLIDGAIPNATVTRDFRPDGLVCTIEVAMPNKEVTADFPVVPR
ncbi:chemotaxis protein CheB [Rhodoplanes serenus]|uniref:chemotaxis protein CheB n=1 Tax=Rhodoplanes serenus TaxID=200615 RepID=UPI000DABAAEB|nr:chemotaxis protein CheB [Rhodoplanes serenus]RAI33681.1 chemotaxis protein [Rhodoplanes serenus]